MFNQQKLQAILNHVVDNKKVFGTSFCIKYNQESWCGASGNLGSNSQYFIASTTKLFVTAKVLNLQQQGKLKLTDGISNYLTQDVLQGLHTLNQTDYTPHITINNLLAHTSGIPDYFQQKDSKGVSLEKQLMGGKDQSWTFNDAINRSKTIKPLFAPNAKGKAHYSDTNFQLLGKIIEQVSGKSIEENFTEIIYKPLGLTKTYLYQNVADNKPQQMYYKSKMLEIPEAMTSFKADGGMVSTSAEMLVFLEAFFNGKFFPKQMVNELTQWNKIFFPMQAGIGLHRFKLPWVFNPLGSIPDLIGHSGLSGALAFYSMQHHLYIAGTVNQIAYPDTSFKLLIKLIQSTLST